MPSYLATLLAFNLSDFMYLKTPQITATEGHRFHICTLNSNCELHRFYTTLKLFSNQMELNYIYINTKINLV